MNEKDQAGKQSESPRTSRRELLIAAGGSVLGASLLGALPGDSGSLQAAETKTLRWGIVGTGGIANSMAPRIGQANHAELAAVSSRRMEKAKDFADRHGAANAFDSWKEMCASDVVDAIYIATPTSVREEIGIEAARNGKHVLGEKPFANLPSLQRITAACRENGVGFMDGTHFVHHPRTHHIRATRGETTGRPNSVASAFQFSLSDTNNIRLRPDLEPYGAIGDTGWYNMRAAVEFLSPDVKIKSVSAYLRREPVNNAVASCSGVIVFDDRSTTTFNCGFESGAGVMDLRITGPDGVIKFDDFLGQRPADQPADFELRQGWSESGMVEVPADKRGAALMFQDYAEMVGDPAKIEASIRASERTQEWLDAVWESALRNEKANSSA